MAISKMHGKSLLQSWFLSVILCAFYAPAALADHAAGHESGALERLRVLLGDGFAQPEFLDVDDAFQLTIVPLAAGAGQGAGQARQLIGAFSVAAGYYLYRDKIQFRGEGAQLAAELPPGEIKNDPFFGEMAVFKHDFSAPITLRGGESGDLRVHASYQGCAEDGICYAPVSKVFSLKLPRLVASARADAPGDAAQGDAQPGDGDAAQGDGDAQPGDAAQFGANSANAAAAQSLPSPLAALLTHSRGLLPAAFLAGLLLSLTPCVLPMLPILSGAIAAQGARITRRRGGLLALAYVLGGATAYAAAGAIAGASGEQLQAYFQNAWVIGLLCAVLLLMALSMFGLFTLEMPAAIRSIVHARSAGLRGALPSVFVLGAVSAVVVGACVSPILIAFLGIAMAAGDAWLGAQMMSVMALGMGAPLLAFGIGAGHLLPRAGKWSVTVNRAFGVMLVAVAIYLLGALPAVPVLWLWAAFLLAVGAYLLSARGLIAGNWRRGARAAGAGLLVW
ncbi:MAG: protein-disulfide reductase DsbD family protein, partial [Gammaproteobacteria bacterium]